jgi:mono/diheme cytochrome c family protein
MKPLALAAVLIAAQATTTQDGVYTAAQATRGATVYADKCASCHSADLAGDGQATPLAGKEFISAWSTQPLGDLFERIHATMPADAPGTVKPADVADVVAFILQKNAAPEGQSELPADRQALRRITIVAPKP